MKGIWGPSKWYGMWSQKLVDKGETATWFVNNLITQALYWRIYMSF